MPVFRMKIADHPFELRVPNDKLMKDMRERYKDFIASDEPKTVFNIAFPPELSGMVDAGEPQSICAGSRIRYWRNDLKAETDDTFKVIQVEMRDLIYTMDALLRIFFSIFLIRSGGLLLHSAAVGLNDEGILFIGESESGKSELSAIAEGDHLTDELSPVLPVDEGFVVYGSPFWGLFEKGGINKGIPVKAAMFIFRNEETRIEPASKAFLLKTLLRCVLNFSKEPAIADRVVQNGIRFLQAAPAARLLTPPAPELWSVVRSFLAENR